MWQCVTLTSDEHVAVRGHLRLTNMWQCVTLTPDEHVAVRDGGAERVLGLDHVLALVLGEDLDDDERALAARRVDEDLEVAARSDWLAVEVPRDLWLRETCTHRDGKNTLVVTSQ